jgi:hypothetical protein
MVTTEPDGDATRFVVRYGDYLRAPYTADLDQMDRGGRLALVLRAAGAGPGETVLVGHENATGLLEDDYVWYECRVAATRAGVVALLAAGFEWAADARRLALGFDVLPEEVEEVRQTASRIARERIDEQQWYTDLIVELQEAEPNSARAAELQAEIRRLHRRWKAGGRPLG